MAIFEEVVLVWAEHEYRIPPGGVLRAIAKVEDILTLSDLADAASRRSYPLGKMAMAYGALLRMCGAKVTDDEVYAGMFKDAMNLPARAIDTLHTLQLLMLPPASLRTAPPKKEGPPTPAGSSAAPSEPVTGSSSDKAG